ncbi:hypothetical protein [Spirosoma validum]|uniref:Uncharacterized protein n=1 Tax=Spirosoma validum TaxID=2771355 RepID=A0A927AZB7_9BACT|nr:hypothetical protein [Spirosoma validum]MBD2752645.1 hypothetical protein [Spirosoma validum]
MNIWRLISYHEEDLKENVTRRFIEHGRIAIGWGLVGDLNQYRSPEAVKEAIRKHYSTSKNGRIGWPTLWHMRTNVMLNDLIIIDAQKPWAKVVEIIGEYEWNNQQPNVANDPNYNHQRPVRLRNDLDPEQLLQITTTRPAPGQAPHLVLFYYGSFTQRLQQNEQSL